MKKKHKDYFGIEPNAKETFGSLFSSLFIEGGIIILIYILYKIFS